MTAKTSLMVVGNKNCNVDMRRKRTLWLNCGLVIHPLLRRIIRFPARTSPRLPLVRISTTDKIFTYKEYTTPKTSISVQPQIMSLSRTTPIIARRELIKGLLAISHIIVLINFWDKKPSKTMMSEKIP